MYEIEDTEISEIKEGLIKIAENVDQMVQEFHTLNNTLKNSFKTQYNIMMKLVQTLILKYGINNHTELRGK